MLIEPFPGIGLAQFRDDLANCSRGLINARGTPGLSGDRYKAYIQWANQTAWVLASQIAADDIDRLVLTRRFWALQSMPEQGESGRLEHLLDAEFQDRTRAFETAMKALDTEIARWKRPGVLVVADSSFYVTHPDKLRDADIAALLPIRDEPVRLVVPIVVIDELDGLKRSGNQQVRWRAGHTLGVLDELLRDPTQAGTLRVEDFSAIDNSTGGIPRGAVTVEVIFDPPAHIRLPIADDEIVDRSLAVQTRSHQPVTFLTYDTGQAWRARSVGVKSIRLKTPLGPEPQ